jgi:hypothetical protein
VKPDGAQGHDDRRELVGVSTRWICSRTTLVCLCASGSGRRNGSSRPSRHSDSWRRSVPCATTSGRGGIVSHLSATARPCASVSSSGGRSHVWHRQPERGASRRTPLRQARSDRPRQTTCQCPRASIWPNHLEATTLWIVRPMRLSNWSVTRCVSTCTSSPKCRPRRTRSPSVRPQAHPQSPSRPRRR